MRLEDAELLYSDQISTALLQKPETVTFTPGFSPVSNDDKKRETVFNGFLVGHNTEGVDYVAVPSAVRQGNR